MSPKKFWPIGEMRRVHAQRARKLRRRGVETIPFGRSKTGRVTYVWFPYSYSS